MLKERLQILVDRDQRRRLDQEAARRGISVGALVRDAIDAEVGSIDQRRKIDAVGRMGRAAHGVEQPSPGELDQLLAAEREANLPPRTRRPAR